MSINIETNISVLNWVNQTIEKYRDKIAYRDADCTLTFGEFDALTRSIGTAVADKVSPGEPVVVLSGRHVLTPAAYLACVRAGAFYAPMDATVPEIRLNSTLGVINAPLMLVDREYMELAESLNFDGEIIAIQDVMATEPNDALLAERAETLTADSPIYVIFTSGSTGVPKGVMTSHRALASYLDSLNEVIDLSDHDVLGNQSPLDYIASIRDIYLPLMTGAETVIIPKNEFAMGGRLFDALNKYGVTTLCWSAAGMELPAKLGAFDESVPAKVNKIVFSGSVLPGKYLKIWQENLPEALFVNQYGPTEATASCTYYVVNEQVDDATVLPIGVPYKHYGILLLNEDGTETALGGVGEICITGPALAIGYYGREDLTSQAFPPNPLSDDPGERIYKTGDYGQIRDDGQLMFLGRKDRQVKHQCNRIMLPEIEYVANQLHGVDECCSLYDAAAELLYLFYTGDEDRRELAKHFRNSLPAYAVPRKIINLEAMPQLPNGKIDMQALKDTFKK